MIEVSHLTKRYAAHTAVEDLSFTVPDVGVYGLLGPNGAGKTTTMNIMTGCLAATSGTVSIGGYDIFEDEYEAKRRLGYLPELPPLYLDSTPREYLDFVARAKGLAGEELRRDITRVLHETNTLDVADRLMRNLSKGYRQRIGIAQALLASPEAVILDEPTVGLDPRQIIEIRELIAELGERRAVILSSHILSEVQAVCGTVLIISRGRLVACDTPEALERLLTGGTAIEIRAEATVEQAGAILEQVPEIERAELKQQDNGTVRGQLTVKDDNAAREIFFAFAGAGVALTELHEARANLEEVFLELTAYDKPAAGKGGDAQ
ncbi:MAG TPA: ABC transporter ATP-binding protein [Candidatus Scatomorpha merdigallinarum]|nr:ABC transporter ATP-binding protein [Candidatus Scatomorpha merdigallinarum]